MEWNYGDNYPKKHYKTSKVVFLPFINDPPSDYDTLYTALRIAEDKRKLVGEADIFVTFDEPQFRKVRQVLQVCRDKNELLHVHVRLGGLHLLFSFLNSINFIMEGNGIRDLFCQFYAENSVDKILQGHAYNRAIRGHTLVHLALGQIMHSTFELTPEEEEMFTQILHSMNDILNMVHGEDFIKLHKNFLDHLERIRARGDTAQLWLLYYDLVTLVKQFIEAERCVYGNCTWNDTKDVTFFPCHWTLQICRISLYIYIYKTCIN